MKTTQLARKLFGCLLVVVLPCAARAGRGPFGNGADGSLTVAVDETVVVNTVRAVVTDVDPVEGTAVEVADTSGLSPNSAVNKRRLIRRFLRNHRPLRHLRITSRPQPCSDVCRKSLTINARNLRTAV